MDLRIDSGRSVRPFIMRSLKGFWASAIRNEWELRSYVARTTIFSAAFALCLDIVNQFAFFSDWADAFRSWSVTIVVAGGIAFVASRAIGQAHLELWRAKAEMEKLSHTDPLTGLLNRRALFALDRQTDAMTLVIADIDRFKQVNDIHGHLIGDDVIRAVAKLMAVSLGDLGYVGRLGGEEFAFLSSDVPLTVLAKRLRAFQSAVENFRIEAGGARVAVTISGGVAVRTDTTSFEDLYAAADHALLAAKAVGRNRFLMEMVNGCQDIIATADDLDAVRAA
jgi:diguanylate cyclase (GGDEF)-like protein